MNKNQNGITNSKNSLLDTIKEISVLGYKGAKEIQQVEGFKIYHIKEPYLSIGEEKIHYPLEFRDVKKFYTSNIPLQVRIKPFIADKSGVYFHKDVTKKLTYNKYRKRYNFHVIFENPVHNYNIDKCINDMIDYMKNISQNNQQNNRIVMLIARKLHDHCFNLIKAHGVYYRIPTHIINLDKVNEILQYCKEKNKPKEMCPDFNAYMLNNYVQLYAKAGGIPWAVSDKDTKILHNTAIVGLAVSRLGNTEYLVGVSYSIAYIGKEVRSYVYSEVFKEAELDIDSLRTVGLYIPARIIKNILTHIKNALSAWNINKYVMFQTVIIHPNEVEGIVEALKDKVWILTHVKESGFAKRIYDLDTEDYGPYRGICLIDEDSLGDNMPIKALLSSTGIIRVKRFNYELKKMVEKGMKTYKPNTTPIPLELEILYGPSTKMLVDKPQIDVGITLYICRLILLLGKLDWEAYTSWPKIPFVEKYARRIADIFTTLYEQKDEESISFVNNLITILQKESRTLKYVM